MATNSMQNGRLQFSTIALWLLLAVVAGLVAAFAVEGVNRLTIALSLPQLTFRGFYLDATLIVAAVAAGGSFLGALFLRRYGKVAACVIGIVPSIVATILNAVALDGRGFALFGSTGIRLVLYWILPSLLAVLLLIKFLEAKRE